MNNSIILRILTAFLIILYLYYIIYYVRSKTKINLKIKKILLNKTFLFLSCIFVIIGTLNLSHPSLEMPSQIASFLIPMTLLGIEI
jgi:hypothetical protein